MAMGPTRAETDVRPEWPAPTSGSPRWHQKEPVVPDSAGCAAPSDRRGALRRASASVPGPGNGEQVVHLVGGAPATTSASVVFSGTDRMAARAGHPHGPQVLGGPVVTARAHRCAPLPADHRAPGCRATVICRAASLNGKPPSAPRWLRISPALRNCPKMFRGTVAGCPARPRALSSLATVGSSSYATANPSSPAAHSPPVEICMEALSRFCGNATMHGHVPPQVARPRRSRIRREGRREQPADEHSDRWDHQHHCRAVAGPSPVAAQTPAVARPSDGRSAMMTAAIHPLPSASATRMPPGSARSRSKAVLQEG